MQVRSRALGALTLSRYRRTSPPFEQQELELAQNLADHAALAIENARLYRATDQARQAAELARESLRRSEEAQRQFFDILKSSPGNLAIMLERARLAAKTGQLGPLEGTVRENIARFDSEADPAEVF